MAENASSAEQVDKVSITVLVEKGKNKVVYAEAGKDFVDVLFSFLTLPLGTIARLVAKDDSNIKPVQFGTISSLYQSVSDLDEQYLWSKTCKEMLLNPRGSIDSLKNVKLNFDDTKVLQSYYLCEKKTCKIENKYMISYFKNQKCICGKLLNQENPLISNQENGFVMETSTYIVSDDLFVMPNLIGTSLNLLQKHGVDDYDVIDKQTVNFSKNEVVDLLKLSLISKTPLSDFIFKKEQFVGNLDPRNQLGVWTGEEKELSNEMVVKVVRRKSNEQVLFVEAGEDFADFLFSFLTFPLGGVLRMLQGFSFIFCIDELYRSVTQLSSSKGLRSQYLKDLLTNPCIPRLSELKNQILPIRSDNYKESNNTFNLVDPKSPISGGYANGPLTFMVTDDLVVTPMSSIDGISYLERMKVPLNDVEEIVINIGQKEGISILKASLISASVLTNSLNQFIAEQDNVSIRVLVEKGKNKVVYAEAGKDFVDVLFSFFTLPLGTIARLVAKEEGSNIKAVQFGSISSLYQSVYKLDEQYLRSKTCKEMLLKPRNSSWNRCKNMKLNIDDTEPLMSYFVCQRDRCKVEYCASYFSQTCIACGGPLDRVKTLNLREHNGFVKQNSTFIVSDDLFVMPNLIGTSLNLLQKHGISSFDTIDKQIVKISKKEIIDLLKLSLVSKTPLSDFILKKAQNVYNLDPRNQLGVLSGEEKEQSDKMVVKVVRRKSNEQILFVEAEQDFADFIFSFLTFTLGGVLHMLQGFSFLCCIDNLYNSMAELSPDRYFVSEKLKNLYKEINKSFKLVGPKSPIAGGFAIAQTFMVTDDLVVTPMSSIDGISYLERMMVPFDDVEEMVINIGQKEGLSILEASLSSTSVLTNGLKQYIGSGAADQTVNPLKKPKEENEA